MAMEAAQYVCDALGFDDIDEVLHYFSTVKAVEMRVKKMIALRKNLFEIASRNAESVAEAEETSLRCLPASISRLDAEIERVQRDGLDVQRAQLDDVNGRIAEYSALFNELWFHLDNLIGKLDRCQVRNKKKKSFSQLFHRSRNARNKTFFEIVRHVVLFNLRGFW